VSKETNRLGYALVDLYVLLYKSEYKIDPVVNKYTEHYNLMVIIEQFGYDKAKALVEYYFKTGRKGHPIKAFMNNYHEIALNMERAEEDRDRRAKIRQATKQRVEEARGESDGTTSNQLGL